jgi:hypothetical protein
MGYSAAPRQRSADNVALTDATPLTPPISFMAANLVARETR